MNVSKNSINMFSLFSQRFGQGSMLKSTSEKLQRQEKAQSQIDYWENQKENLKEMECDTVEEIARKLEMFHSYEDEIAAARQAYNFEQMHHVLDEAQEQGEKIAEAAKKTEPKTEEERKKEALEEAAGTEETGGILEDILDEMMEAVEELAEEVTQEVAQELDGEVTENLPAGTAKDVQQFEGTSVQEEQQQYQESIAETRQQYQELAEKYAGTASDIEARKGVQLDYRM